MKAKTLGRVLMVSLQLAAILLCLLSAFPSEAGEKQARKARVPSRPSRSVLESEGLTYVYETMGEDEAMLKRYDFSTDNTGQITISESAPGGNIVLQERYTSTPGCDRFPTISRFPTKADVEENWFVVVCGSDGGRHQTIKAFLEGITALDIKTASLDFENSFPNLAYDPEHGFYVARVYKRVLLDDIGYGVVEYAMAYRLLIDQTVFTFVPVFGAPVEQFYFDYYLELKDQMMRRKSASIKEADHENGAALFGHYYGPMLGALVSTEDKDRICSETGAVKSLGLTSQDLRAWRKRLARMGYPDFNFDKCGVTK